MNYEPISAFMIAAAFVLHVSGQVHSLLFDTYRKPKSIDS